MGSIKEINIKSLTYYFLATWSNLLKTGEKLHKDIDIYYICFVTVKDSDYITINSVNPSYIMIGKENVYIEEKNEVNI